MCDATGLSQRRACRLTGLSLSSAGFLPCFFYRIHVALSPERIKMDDFRPHLPVSDAQLPSQADVVAQLQAFVQDREAFSDNTWRQLLSVMRICSGWANEHGRAFLPMSPCCLRDYLFWLQANGRASSTIATHLALICMLHRNAGLTPPGTSPVAFRAMKKLNRTAVTGGERTGQAIPFRLPDLLILDSVWSGSARLQQLRDLAFLHVAYATLLRVSELGRLRVRDISRAADGRVVLDVGWTKTIVMTGGLIKGLGTLS